jgi:proline iminopeptidase
VPGAEYERRVRLHDGASLWTTVSGAGPPVVCCHGGPGLWDYLASLAALIDDRFTAVRFDQRGCGRSTGSGPFTIAQAVDDLDQLRRAFGYERWAVVGHSWGAELALRYAARFPQQVTGVGYLAGIGAGNDYRAAYAAQRRVRLGTDFDRWQELGAKARTPDEEREWCLLQWRPDFAPGSAVQHAQALWDTRPPDIEVNTAANRQLWADRDTEDLLGVARSVRCRVLMLFGADDPRPWAVTTPLYEALPAVERVVLDGAGHAPWAERPDDVRDLLSAFLSSVSVTGHHQAAAEAVAWET